MMVAINLAQEELEAVESAVEDMVYLVQEGKRWQNEPPEMLRALRQALRKLQRKVL